MDEETTTATPAAEPEPPKKRKSGGMMKRLFIFGVPLLLIGGGAWWMLAGSDGKVEAAADNKNIEERGVVPFETFLVNLSDPGGNRFLKLTLQLAFATEADAKHIQENAALMGHARSVILELLTEQKAPALITPEGKQKLKDDVKAHVAKVFGKNKVLDVLFAEFVVQF